MWIVDVLYSEEEHIQLFELRRNGLNYIKLECVQPCVDFKPVISSGNAIHKLIMESVENSGLLEK